MDYNIVSVPRNRTVRPRSGRGRSRSVSGRRAPRNKARCKSQDVFVVWRGWRGAGGARALAGRALINIRSRSATARAPGAGAPRAARGPRAGSEPVPINPALLLLVLNKNLFKNTSGAGDAARTVRAR
ncbi:hypothetical protein EVAR_65565_1 [Eumeta japonica]|uniref:Uncharacterized protein n=1 Tax=Eumeta variegata TaxID=151549 RepID=A0A4C1ZAA9_EUMVA|nr:hypothetical protein EVAR_65565_1 [Eumeta japonica]